MRQVSDKVHKCKGCKLPYERLKAFQTRCVPCLAIIGRQVEDRKRVQAVKDYKANTKRMKAAAPVRRGDCVKTAQEAFNRYVRNRDAALPCVSCLRFHDGKWDAGHYLSVGARPELRFHPDNVWRQCSPCNTRRSGNPTPYRIELIKRIGVERVEWLEGPHAPAKYTIPELQALTDKYRALTRELAKSI